MRAHQGSLPLFKNGTDDVLAQAGSKSGDHKARQSQPARSLSQRLAKAKGVSHSPKVVPSRPSQPFFAPRCSIPTCKTGGLPTCQIECRAPNSLPGSAEVLHDVCHSCWLMAGNSHPPDCTNDDCQHSGRVWRQVPQEMVLPDAAPPAHLPSAHLPPAPVPSSYAPAPAEPLPMDFEVRK